MEKGAGPRAVVVLRRDGDEVLLGPVYGAGRCDLGFVDDLLRVQLAARRFGWYDPAPRGAGGPARADRAGRPHDDLVGLSGAQRVANGGYSSVSRKA